MATQLDAIEKGQGVMKKKVRRMARKLKEKVFDNQDMGFNSQGMDFDRDFNRKNSEEAKEEKKAQTDDAEMVDATQEHETEAKINTNNEPEEEKTSEAEAQFEEGKDVEQETEGKDVQEEGEGKDDHEEISQAPVEAEINEARVGEEPEGKEVQEEGEGKDDQEEISEAPVEAEINEARIGEEPEDAEKIEKEYEKEPKEEECRKYTEEEKAGWILTIFKSYDGFFPFLRARVADPRDGTDGTAHAFIVNQMAGTPPASVKLHFNDIHLKTIKNEQEIPSF
ncbi:hypothetical protein YC2023_116412 [Brassica napus]